MKSRDLFRLNVRHPLALELNIQTLFLRVRLALSVNNWYMCASGHQLSMFDLPVVKDVGSLSDLVHLSSGLLYRLSRYNNSFYSRFRLKKKGGGNRFIFSPTKEMKAVQAWILRMILDRIQVSESAMGFRKGKNIFHNALCHKGNRYFLCLDIENFFPSIPYSKIYNVFKTIGYDPHVSHIFSALCTCDGILPQGGVTSPSLSNIICNRMDRRIAGYVGKQNITYTRYADDMVFSSINPRRLVGIKRVIAEILISEGFTLNEAKTRFLGPRRQRKVTGLVMSDDSFGIGRIKKRKLRATIHRLVKKKLSQKSKDKLVQQINGWLAFIYGVDRKGFGQIAKYAKNLFKRNGIRRSILKFPKSKKKS
jgi:RNA-directed DNA polymerase